MTVGTAVKVKVPLCGCLDSGQGQGPPVWVFGQRSRSRSPCVGVWTAVKVKVPLCGCLDNGQGPHV